MIAAAAARWRGTVSDQVLQGAGWLLVAIGLTGTEYTTPALIDFGVALTIFWLIVATWRILRAHRGRRYLRLLG